MAPGFYLSSGLYHKIALGRPEVGTGVSPRGGETGHLSRPPVGSMKNWDPEGRVLVSGTWLHARFTTHVHAHGNEVMT